MRLKVIAPGCTASHKTRLLQTSSDSGQMGEGSGARGKRNRTLNDESLIKGVRISRVSVIMGERYRQ